MTKSNEKSNNQTRGGKRPGAGRPRKDDDPRSRRVQSAVDSLESALKAYDDQADGPFTPMQHRWHLAMVLFGVPTDVIAAALSEPQISKNFSRDIADAIQAAKAAAS